jgi:hypothetical protein
VRAAHGLAVEAGGDVPVAPPVVVGEEDVLGDAHLAVDEIAEDRHGGARGNGVDVGHVIDPHAALAQRGREVRDDRRPAARPGKVELLLHEPVAQHVIRDGLTDRGRRDAVGVGPVEPHDLLAAGDVCDLLRVRVALERDHVRAEQPVALHFHHVMRRAPRAPIDEVRDELHLVPRVPALPVRDQRQPAEQPAAFEVFQLHRFNGVVLRAHAK